MSGSEPLDRGRPDAFLTREELLEVQCLSTFLHYSNSVDKGAASRVTHPMDPRNRNTALYRVLAEFTDLLVRHNEVVAVTSANDGTVLQGIEVEDAEFADDAGQGLGEEDQEPIVTYTQNLGDQKTSNPRSPAALKAKIQSTAPVELGSSIGRWLVPTSKRSKPRSVTRWHQTTGNVSRSGFSTDCPAKLAPASERPGPAY
jgi:hypothetical protein